ncbi:MAG: ThiF family adenylyltransferase [Chloroflexi bacterium]|nr:ThiF family adenylyltransferase [Chloroflexota bacterium]MYC01560.1 ThiF family adenylyltransferase [Chloroflexota bacterium]
MAPGPVDAASTLRLPRLLATSLERHLFPGDNDEHGAVIGAALVETERERRLLGRRLFLAMDGRDYVPGERGYRMLTADFVRRSAIACAEEGLAYLAVHNHPGSDRTVAFSNTDLASQRRGYPAVLDILNGPPAGALVFGQRSVAGNIWLTPENQIELAHATLSGTSQERRHASPLSPPSAGPEYDRQVRLFGDRGQAVLRGQKVAVVGAGGAGSLINEYLARLGVGHIVIVDYDRLDKTNMPRVVGARRSDLGLRPPYLGRLLRRRASPKVVIAERVAREARTTIKYEAIVGSVTEPAVAERLLDCDAIFLAADSMQARLVINALCHQYLIPVWQVGAKVVNDPSGAIEDVFSVVRHLVPGESCLWCNELVDPTRLAEEAASPDQREAQRYVDEVPAPSVITLNAVAAAHAVNQYLFSTLELPAESDELHWLRYRSFEPYVTVELPRRAPECRECQGRLGAGTGQTLPLREA